MHYETLTFVRDILIDLRDHHIGYDKKTLSELIALIKTKLERG